MRARLRDDRPGIWLSESRARLLRSAHGFLVFCGLFTPVARRRILRHAWIDWRQEMNQPHYSAPPASALRIGEPRRVRVSFRRSS